VGADPAITVYRGPFYSNLMPLTARLERAAGESCLLARRQDEPGNRLRTFFPVWPEGTKPVRARDGRLGIELAQGGRSFEGELFQAGGSNYALNVRPPSPDVPTFSRPPGGCSAYEGYFIVASWGIRRL
jgi:hypothetical protein